MLWPSLLLAQAQAGVYSYSKGLNKASSHAYVFPLSPDSVFVYLHSVGAAPEFNTHVLRGWLHQKRLLLHEGDSLVFSFLPQSLRIQTSGALRESALAGQYKLATKQVKQLPALLFPHPSFTAKPGKDTVLSCYSLPTATATMQRLAFSRMPITVLDSFQQFYLVEHPQQKRAFLWVPQSQFAPTKKISLPKK